MELIFEHTGQVAEPIFGSAHFPDNYLRGFFIDSYTNKLMMTKASTPYGNFSNLQWSEPAVAFERAKVTECRLHYMPQEFLFGLCLIKNNPVLLYYDTNTEQFYDVVEVLGRILGFNTTPLKSAIALEWQLPTAQHLLDKVVIRRKLDEYPNSADDGTEIYSGDGTYVKDGNLLMGQRYYYRAFPHSIDGDIIDDAEGQQVDDTPLDILLSLYIVHSNYVILQGIRTVESNDDYNIGALAQNSLGRISDSEISNKSSGINSVFNSYIISQNNIGTNNEIALHSEEKGRIAKIGSQPEGMQDELEETGGIIL